MTKKTIISKSKEQTQQIGELLAEELGKTRIIALYGDLGSGKTTFVQGLARGLGVEQRLISPTFIIVRSYKIKTENSKFSFARGPLANIRNFYHIDLYRIESEKELEDLGLKEILDDKNALVVIEWAEKLGEHVPQKRWDLRFRYVDENTREITIEKHG